MACSQLLVNAREAWSEFEAAMAELAELEAKVASDKVQLEAECAKMEKDQQQLEEERIELEVQKEAMSMLGAGSNDLVSLSFRGEKVVTVKRSTLCQVDGSMMAAMFSWRHDDKLDFDRDGNVFLSYPPQVKLPLVDWLTTNIVLPPEAKHDEIDIPSEYNGLWEGVLNFFGVEEAVRPRSTMFSGIKTNLKMNDLEGWAVASCEPYSHETTLEDFRMPGVPGDSAVLVGAKKAGADELILAAIGRLDVFTAVKLPNHTQLHNGVYWYCTPGNSMGFAPDATVHMAYPDMHDANSYYRMSWHLAQEGGWRAGQHRGLFNSTEIEKVIMKPRHSVKMSE